jgi:hypothetical protein
LELIRDEYASGPERGSRLRVFVINAALLGAQVVSANPALEEFREDLLIENFGVRPAPRIVPGEIVSDGLLPLKSLYFPVRALDLIFHPVKLGPTFGRPTVGALLSLIEEVLLLLNKPDALVVIVLKL